MIRERDADDFMCGMINDMPHNFDQVLDSLYAYRDLALFNDLRTLAMFTANPTVLHDLVCMQTFWRYV